VAAAIDAKYDLIGTCAITFIELNRFERARWFLEPNKESEFAKSSYADIALRENRVDLARTLIEKGAYESMGSTAYFLALLRKAPRSEIHRAAEEYVARWREDSDSEPKLYVGIDLAYGGENELSLSMLRRALEDGYIICSAMDHASALDPLRANPEFIALRGQAIERQKSFLAHRAERGRVS